MAYGVHWLVGGVPALTAALSLGVSAVNLGLVPDVARAGARFAASRLMRVGVVLLGLQVAIGDIVDLGWETIAMAVLVLISTLVGTRWLGRRMGLSPRLSLLVASGFAICGASAVAAVDCALGQVGRYGQDDRDAKDGQNGEDGEDRRDGEHGQDGEDRRDGQEQGGDNATAVALVTLCGTLAIAVMPAAGRLLGLSPYDLGRWVGASVHDVGQVVATAAVVGPAALVPAVAVKLVRVAMLAPVTAVVAFTARRESTGGRRRPVLPVFLLGFLALVAVRSSGTVPGQMLAAASDLKNLLFAAAMFGLGCAVRLRVLAGTGRRALLLGLTSWVLIAGVSYAGVVLTR